ncbi:NAD(P)/FAD-dependent oxidoreductase [Lewinella sp. W8]|uniref:flavin monoamine oxidase family protein n=1 Tax=Lewinella sp. W8 TaxID=2528208 RepID=UPI001067255F|nr:NAD(P)/FAD-dependent oxidoreductase [Lewinella sp. W8]MTB52830.1 FAD-dependent oxidoreductase [Lewinella sp. W8]
MNHHSVIIIGAGLTGLTLAYRLQRAGTKALVLEGRPRPGGRIFTHYAPGKAPVEMGATWLGLKHRHLVGLLRELEIPLFQQQLGQLAMYDPGPERPAEKIPFPPDQEPSFRITGGSSALIQTLMDRLAEEQIIFDQPVETLDFTGKEALVRTRTETYRADRVVSTLPPNLMIDALRFTPALPPALEQLARQTHTWMGESIKAGLRFQSPFWRTGHQSGTLFSNAGPLTEAYEHADAKDEYFALKGFLHPGLVRESPIVRERMVREQLQRVYESYTVSDGEYLEYPWAEDPFTYVPYPQPVGAHQHNGHPAFRQSQFGGKFLMAGSETAKAFPGYMDGAVESAELTAKQLLNGNH